MVGWRFCVFLLPFVVLMGTLWVHSDLNSMDSNLKKETVKGNKFGFATVSTPAFAMGAVVLGHLLEKYHGDRFDRICLVTPDVNETWRNILGQWWKVIPVKEFKPYVSFRRSWTKLHLWDQIEYKKLVYLDTDLLVLGDLSELFNYSQLSCAYDTNPPQICNTGVVILEPQEGMFEKMKHAIYEKKLYEGIGDQGFINSFFGSFTPIHPSYNVPRISGTGLGDQMKRNVTKIVHYVCKKPWKCGREGRAYCGCGYKRLNYVWWEHWDEACANKQCIESWKE